jgi:GT2 family glycosyltransferase
MAQPKIVTIVLNTNRRQDTLECLSSLERGVCLNCTIIVLDNASADGSVEAIRADFPAVQIIPLAENHGYAGNNNVGIQAALAQGADWVFVLNEDTILAPDCLSRLVEAGEGDPRVGVVGPMVFHHNEPNVIQSAGGRLSNMWVATHIGQNEVDQGQYSTPRRVDWISGCGILVRRAVIEQIGMLDEQFYYYWEETEWCIRARKAGWDIVHVPQAKLWHKGVQRDYRPAPSVTYYNTRNRLIALSKHHAPLRVWICTWWQAFRILASWTIRPIWRSKRAHRDAMWRGIMDFLAKSWGPRPT